MSRSHTLSLSHTQSEVAVVLRMEFPWMRIEEMAPEMTTGTPYPERLVFYCRTTSASTAPRTARKTRRPYTFVPITDLLLTPYSRHLPSLHSELYLTQSIHQLVLESQLSNKIVNLLFTITN